MKKVTLFFFPEKNNNIINIVTIVTIGCLLAHFAIIVFGYSHLPATIPTHYNLQGVADGYGAKDNTIIGFIISGIIFIVLSFLIQSEFIYRNYKGNPEDYGKLNPVTEIYTRLVLTILRIVVISIFLILGIIAFF